VEAEIRALPGPGAPGFRAAAEGAQAAETIVHAIRRLRRIGDQEGAKALIEPLLERATPVVSQVMKSHFPARDPRELEDREDAGQQVAEQLWREVFDTSSAQEFWEVFFERMVRLACSDAAGRIRKQREHERLLAHGEDKAGDAWDEAQRLPDPKSGDALFLSEALAGLPPDVARALYLKALGYQTDSKDPAEQTIARLLGVTGRTVSTYLRTGEAALRRWLEAGGATGRGADDRESHDST
jgi:DNA-directed RNA polymerase specialized sigma24 family protein